MTPTLHAESALHLLIEETLAVAAVSFLHGFSSHCLGCAEEPAPRKNQHPKDPNKHKDKSHPEAVTFGARGGKLELNRVKGLRTFNLPGICDAKRPLLKQRHRPKHSQVAACFSRRNSSVLLQPPAVLDGNGTWLVCAPCRAATKPYLRICEAASPHNCASQGSILRSAGRERPRASAGTAHPLRRGRDGFGRQLNEPSPVPHMRESAVLAIQRPSTSFY